jgi:WD40 repeat protein
VAFSPDGHILAVGCTNGEVDLWPLDGASSGSGALKPFVVKKHQALVWSLAFSPDGKTLASGSADNNVVIWDVPTGEDLLTLKHNGTVEALQFSPDGRLLASASHEPSRGSVCLWRAPADDDAPQNTLRSVEGPTVSDRPAGLDSATAMRPAYPGPTATSGGQPVQNGRRAVNPATPAPAAYAPADDDRYNTAPGPAAWPATSSTDPSVPLQTGGMQAFGSGTPSADGLTQPSGASQPSGAQGNPNGGRPTNGKRARPAF